MQKIKNIIFDLGGVILNINLELTEQAFARLGVHNFHDFYTMQKSVPLFDRLETGKISPLEFFNELRDTTGLSLTDEEIVQAWNALLLDFPKERIQWLEQIRNQYKIYLLSNTNQIHYNAFIKTFKDEFNEDFNNLFITAYYSHHLGLRKPSVEIFETVLNKEQLIPAETLFIDDTRPNIDAAASVGLQTIHLIPPKTLLDLKLQIV